MSRGVMRTRNMTLARQPGELGRLRVLGGPDSGTTFVILAPKVKIGRGEENDVVLGDLKASRSHAEIAVAGAFPAQSFSVRDLGSSHGILVNGNKSTQANLRSGDKLGIGETVLEFIGIESGSTKMLTVQPVKMSDVVGGGLSGLTQFIQKVAEPMRPSTPGQKSETWVDRNKKMVVVLAILVAVASLLPEVEQKQRVKKNKYLELEELEAGRFISSIQPPQVNSESKKKADVFVLDATKELRAKNWMRARASLETALQIFPDHYLAHAQLDSLKKSMEVEAKSYMANGKRNEDANRFKQARIQYESVTRMFERDQSNPLYKEAAKSLEDLAKKEKEAELL